MNLLCYKMNCEKNRVDKSEFMTDLKVISGVFKEETSITNPTIEIQYRGIFDYNYIYIRELHRYYYVDEVKSTNYGLWEIDLSIDVLMTYREQIYENVAMIDRNEENLSPDIPDKKRLFYEGYNVEELYPLHSPNVIKSDFDPNTDAFFVLSGYKLQAEE